MTRSTAQRWLLLVALDQEIAGISHILANQSSGSWQDHQWTSGQINRSEILATVTGVGKVHAAMTTQHWLDTFKPTAVLVLGLAGALSPDLQQGDFLIGHTLMQHDVVANEMFPAYHIPRPDRKTLLFKFQSDPQLIDQVQQLQTSHPLKMGTIVSGDYFVAGDDNKRRELIETFAADAVDMESAAIAQVCHIHQVPLLVVQTISDSADRNAVQTFESFLPQASKNIAAFTKEFFAR